MLCVKYSNRTKKPCPRYDVLVQDLKHSNTGIDRTLEEIKNALNDYEFQLAAADGLWWLRLAYVRTMKEGAKKNLQQLSMHALMPLLCDFPFVGIKNYLYIYRLFSEEAFICFIQVYPEC